MPRDVNNVYTLPEAPFTANTVALSARVNNNNADIAAALTESFTRAETTPFTRTLLDDADQAAAQATLGMGWVLCEAPRVVSAVAQADFALPTTFRRFRMNIQGVQADAVGRSLAARFSTDGGATFIAGTSYSYAINTTNSAGANSSAGSAAAGCVLLNVNLIPNSGAGNFEYTFEFTPGSATLATGGRYNSCGFDGINFLSCVGAGSALVSGVRANALRIYTGTAFPAGTAGGTFSGTLILEGLR